MSASLVGSEMCIRDSATRNPSNTTARSEITPEAAGPVCVPDAPDAAGSCLLYTSDAADDM
eukprot:1212228-Alexandrium_andersonii.AAC.1